MGSARRPPRVISTTDIPSQDILPILIVDFNRDPPAATTHTGTGFLIGKNIMVTCWHCVRTELPQGQQYIVVRATPQGWGEPIPLHDIQQDTNGADLATARVDLEPEIGLSITGVAGTLGTEVWSFGYPHTGVEPSPTPEFDKLLRPNPRYMQSYVMRVFLYDQPEFGRTLSYELDMSALLGMSGAPIMRANTREVLGVLYGRNDVETIEEFGSRDPDTGERLTPEVVRMTYFALAHHNTTLHTLKGKATQGLPLGQFLRS